MNTSITIRPRGTFIAGIVIMLFCAVAFVYGLILLAQDALELWTLTLPFGIGVVSWLTLVAPRMVISDEAVTVRNPFVVHHIPMGVIEDVSTRFGLELFLTNGAKVSAWGAPPPPTFLRAFTKKVDRRALPASLKDAPLRPSDAPGSASGDAFVTLKRCLEREHDTTTAKRSRPSWLDLALVIAALLLITLAALHY